MLSDSTPRSLADGKPWVSPHGLLRISHVSTPSHPYVSISHFSCVDCTRSTLYTRHTRAPTALNSSSTQNKRVTHGAKPSELDYGSGDPPSSRSSKPTTIAHYASVDRSANRSATLDSAPFAKQPAPVPFVSLDVLTSQLYGAEPKAGHIVMSPGRPVGPGFQTLSPPVSRAEVDQGPQGRDGVIEHIVLCIVDMSKYLAHLLNCRTRAYASRHVSHI